MEREKANVAQLEIPLDNVSKRSHGARRIRLRWHDAFLFLVARPSGKSVPRQIPAPFRDFSVKNRATWSRLRPGRATRDGPTRSASFQCD